MAFQVLAARNLRASQHRYRSLVDRARDVIFTVNREGNITSLNPAFEAVTGLPAAAVAGPARSCPWWRASTPEETWTRLQAGSGPAFELPVRAARGERMLEVAVAMTTDASGDLLGIGRDVSERKEAEARRAQLETQLRQSQKREAIGTLASGIAHDFNNVLTAIMGHAQLLQEECPGPLQARASEILQAGARARDVVRQLLTFARSTGQEHRPVRLQQVVTEALQLMRASLPASVALESSIDSGTAMVLADQGQMHQVVINLVTNAAAALHGRTGKVVVQLGNLPPSGGEGTPSSQGVVRLRVMDDGVGMTAEVLERIFEPFFTTRATGEGTGLGLAVVQGIVQDHGGQIYVRSAPGKGTTLDVELPAASVERLEPAEPLSEALPGAGERLLVVDDEPVVARVVSEQLRRLGYHVTAVNDPEEALELLAEDPDEFDLLLTDLQMPTDGRGGAGGTGGPAPARSAGGALDGESVVGPPVHGQGGRHPGDRRQAVPARGAGPRRADGARAAGGAPPGEPRYRELTKRTTVRIVPPVSKGDQTRERILRHAAKVASRDGLEGLSIGELASALEMSKSGLFAHFGSKEDLQVAVLRAASADFQEKVIRPALHEPRGPARLRALFERWERWASSPETPGGCLFAGASFELDDRPGPARDFLVEEQRRLLAVLSRSAQLGVESGLLRADLDCDLLAFQIHGLMLGYHHARRLLRQRNAEAMARKAFEQLLAQAMPAR